MTVEPVSPDDEQPHSESREGNGPLAGWGRPENVEQVKENQNNDERPEGGGSHAIARMGSFRIDPGTDGEDGPFDDNGPRQ